MKVIDKIVISTTEPSSTNVGWYDGKSLKLFANGKWSPVSDVQEQVNVIVANSLNTPI